MQVWTAALTLVLVLSMIFFLYSVFGKKSSFSDVEDEYNHIKSYPRPVFHLLGDSITENSFDPDLCGFGSYLVNHYRRRADIINRGYSGYTTEYILKMMPYLYPKNAHRNTLPIFATLMLGSNDATGSCDTFKHLTTDQYKSNLRKIIVYLKNLTSNPKIILLTPPPIGKQYQYPLNCSEKCCFGRGNSETEKYVKVVKEVGELFQIPTIDIYQRFLGVDNYSSLLYDGLHPNCLGNRIIFDEIVNTIEYISILLICNRKYYPDLSVNSTKLPYHFPANREFRKYDNPLDFFWKYVEKYSEPNTS